jgi:hypothetical protein
MTVVGVINITLFPVLSSIRSHQLWVINDLLTRRLGRPVPPPAAVFSNVTAVTAVT